MSDLMGNEMKCRKWRNAHKMAKWQWHQATKGKANWLFVKSWNHQSLIIITIEVQQNNAHFCRLFNLILDTNLK